MVRKMVKVLKFSNKQMKNMKDNGNLENKMGKGNIIGQQGTIL